MNPLRVPSLRNGARAILAAVLIALVGYVGVWQWMFCRIEVPAGYSLLLRYKGPWPFGTRPQAPEGTLVQTDAAGRPMQVGILEAMPGPGRHFYSPLEFETQLVKDEVIPPGKIGVQVSRIGKPLPEGAYLVDEKGYRGILRKVLTPGRYRINTYQFEVKVVDVDACAERNAKVNRKPEDPTLIPPGYVGRGDEQGERSQHGRGSRHPEERPPARDLFPQSRGEADRHRQHRLFRDQPDGGGPAAGRHARLGGARPLGTSTTDDPVYIPGKGIEFPSSDGFPIHLDYTAIWGILPEQAPEVVRQFGTLKDVEQKVILPQIESICRLHGSRRGAVDLLVGDTREKFQDETSVELERILTSKKLSLLFGLTRHIYVPKAVREPIQKAKIADELTKTRDQEQLTAKAQAELTEAKAKVVLEERRTRAETDKRVAEVAAEGEKKAKEIEAMTEKLRAEVDAKSATIEARTTLVLGEAQAKSVKLAKEARAERFQLLVKAMGGPEAYDRYIFAEGLPADLRLGVFYAGPGTLWTDLKGFEQTMLGKLVSDAQAKGGASSKPSPELAAESRKD